MEIRKNAYYHILWGRVYSRSVKELPSGRRRGSVPLGIHRIPLDHEYDGLFQGSGAVQDPAGDGISLLRKKLQRSRLQIQKQRPLQDEKELVLSLVLVPMELPFKDAQADDAIVDLGQIEVDPFLGVLADHAGNVDDLAALVAPRRLTLLSVNPATPLELAVKAYRLSHAEAEFRRELEIYRADLGRAIAAQI